MAIVARRRIASDLRRNLIEADRQLRRDIRASMNFTGTNIVRDFDLVVSDWTPKNRPKFLKKVTVKPNGTMRLTVRPYAGRKSSQIFDWVDQGTKGPYPIPKTASAGVMLRFRSGYKPRTAPIARAGVGPGVATGAWVSKRQVMHPGIKARKFSQAIQAKNIPDLRQRIENSFKSAARRANKRT